MKKIILLLAAAILFSTLGLCAERVRISFEVVCDNPTATKLTNAIAERLQKREDIEISDRLPKAKLYVYAQQDVEDRVNPNGWSFAVAHVSNLPTFYVGAKLLDSSDKVVETVKPVLMDMLREQGFMRYMNVGHMDELTSEGISKVADNFVGEFLKRALQ